MTEAVIAAVRELAGRDVFSSWSERDGVREELADLERRLTRPRTLAVLGEFSSGKSYLLNALLGRVRRENGAVRGLLAVDINPSTATITELSYAPGDVAVARYPSGRVERVPIDRLGQYVAVASDERGALHDAMRDDDDAPSFVEIGIPSPFLESGYVIADTPGLASLNPAHRRATLGYLPRVDAVLYLIDTQQPFSDGDAAFLQTIGEHVGTTFIVQTKIDLWRMTEANGLAAWENARDRIARRAAHIGAAASVFAVSAYDFAAGTIDGDDRRVEASGFPALVNALATSLDERVGTARRIQTHARAGAILVRAIAFAENERVLALCGDAELDARRAEAEPAAVAEDAALADDVRRAADAARDVAAAIAAGGARLREAIGKGLASALDVADIERLRDRNRLHVIVDAAARAPLETFASTIADDVASRIDAIASGRAAIDAVGLAARALGGDPATGAWTRGVAAGLRSVIVLEALGGPTATFVQRVAAAFAGAPPGTYMKRELLADSRRDFFPRLEADVDAFVGEIAARIEGAFAAAREHIERERAGVRARRLDPIDRARGNPNRAAKLPEIERALQAALDLQTSLTEPGASNQPRRHGAATAASFAAQMPFDRDAYARGLVAERYRVVVLGALRRGKSSLINALAGRTILADNGANEARFPIHVRYGPADCAYTLGPDGAWHEIDRATAMHAAGEAPVLLETPWPYAPQLVLVHAPAFDSGFPDAEAIALAAAAAASLVLVLFSRQLSDRELAIAGRIAEGGTPMLFAHTIADHETASERRKVVSLAERYLRERGIPAERVFTVSARNELEARAIGGRAAAWNEFGALRETIAARADEHMTRLAARAAVDTGAAERSTADGTDPGPARPPLGRVLRRILRR